MENSIPYSSIQDINVVSRWDAGQRFCLRVTIADGSLLLQVSNINKELFSKHSTFKQNAMHCISPIFNCMSMMNVLVFMYVCMPHCQSLVDHAKTFGGRTTICFIKLEVLTIAIH